MEKIAKYCSFVDSGGCGILERQKDCSDCAWYALEEYMKVIDTSSEQVALTEQED